MNIINMIMNKTNIDTIPVELLVEILKNLDIFSIANLARTVKFPKEIINLPIFMGMHTVLDCVFMTQEYDKKIVSKLIKEGADPLKKYEGVSAFFTLYCWYKLKFITEYEFHETYNILFPGDLSFTRSGKCYSGVYYSTVNKI